MERLQPSTIAWAAIAGGIVLYDLLAPPGQTLSEGVDRALEHSGISKALTLGAIGCTALHLANAIPDKLDLFKISLTAVRQ